MIYLIGCSKTNTCKIGYANIPEQRLMQLQTGNPYSLELLSVIDGDISSEKELHLLFSKYRLKGEWFEYHDDIKSFFKVEDVFIVTDSLLNLFKGMEGSEIRVYSSLLRFANGVEFSIDKTLRISIGEETTLKERTVYSAIIVLEKKKLIFKHDGLFRLNPRHIFKGSYSDRNKALKNIIEIACKQGIEI